ncbi:hypothetical protein HDU76_009304 [Blyttiomyces sp. JEL0837]|nr:hypothetical protein HDU76_009304 [Blyttiomyces sp. JEL0837]
MYSANLNFDQIHLMGQWFWPETKQRTQELVRVLAINTNNSFIHGIHLIQPESPSLSSNPSKLKLRQHFERIMEFDAYFPFDSFMRKLRVATTNNTGRLLASDAFLYASHILLDDPIGAGPHWIGSIQRRISPRQRKGRAKRLRTEPEPRKIAILANQDIYFDKTLGLLLSSPDVDLSPLTTYFLSRWEESTEAEEASLIGTQCGPKFVGSHDAFVFIPPLPTPLIAKCQYELGSWGIEARMLWEFERFGITGRNPCEDVKIWHVHFGGYKEGAGNVRSDIQTSSEKEAKNGSRNAATMPVVNTDGKSSIAFPDKLKSKYKKVIDELWGAQLHSDDTTSTESVKGRKKGKGRKRVKTIT